MYVHVYTSRYVCHIRLMPNVDGKSGGKVGTEGLRGEGIRVRGEDVGDLDVVDLDRDDVRESARACEQTVAEWLEYCQVHAHARVCALARVRAGMHARTHTKQVGRLWASDS